MTQVHNRQILKNSSPHVNMCEIIGKCYRLSVHIYPDKNKHSLGSDTHFVQPKGEGFLRLEIAVGLAILFAPRKNAERMSDKNVRSGCQKKCQRECQMECQIKCQR